MVNVSAMPVATAGDNVIDCVKVRQRLAAVDIS